MGDEIKNARRVVPPALIVAGVIVTAGYILGTIAILVALPRSQVNNMEGIMQAISSAGAKGLTVTEVHGFGQQYGHMPPGRSADQTAFVLPKLRVDVLVQDESAGPVADAIAKSVNTAAVHLCDEVGIGEVIKFARRLGIESPIEPTLATALGTNGVSLLELTRAYAVFDNGGKRVVPRYIRKVTDREGNVLLERVALGTDFEAVAAADAAAAAAAPASEPETAPDGSAE